MRSDSEPSRMRVTVPIDKDDVGSGTNSGKRFNQRGNFAEAQQSGNVWKRETRLDHDALLLAQIGIGVDNHTRDGAAEAGFPRAARRQAEGAIGAGNQANLRRKPVLRFELRAQLKLDFPGLRGSYVPAMERQAFHVRRTSKQSDVDALSVASQNQRRRISRG